MGNLTYDPQSARIKGTYLVNHFFPIEKMTRALLTQKVCYCASIVQQEIFVLALGKGGGQKERVQKVYRRRENILRKCLIT